LKRVSVALRQRVQNRANKRCEYCGLPEAFASFSFQADHIISVKHGGKTSFDNLAWACFRCNNLKGSDVASYDEATSLLTPFYNPRTQIWAEHFALHSDGVLTGKTASGRVTVQILGMNHPKLVELRQLLLKAGRW
jgi:5-methylcytosine-specific restriction endonuclease McrA